MGQDKSPQVVTGRKTRIFQGAFGQLIAGCGTLLPPRRPGPPVRR